MSFLKKLFGIGGDSKPATEPAAPEQEHAGFMIRATPFQQEGRWQLCGVITRDVDGATQEHKFIRADSFGSREEAVEMAFFKARQIIDMQGDYLFK